ncbi:uncharacterized protein LOC111716755 isoform X2 [Eurytemora carolleeae]|uniref:uncharacterized protein LOC111716755 isoform X2 n=1 Tax=Eurytemora carolleeae TaxID=1294199 RepID=UPI000C779BFC|nr:uncharacterized protein LOC111716755 isoform X2 [Eurytemora carolleeae]|eukprot:XP_023348001.1 uncharacterized protein LOC111716755 isoform X2 [Eurytemora affinis]
MVVYERKIYIISGRYAEEGVEGVRTTTIAHDVDTQRAYPSADSVSLFEHCAVLDENYPGHPAILVLGGYAKNLGKLMKTVNVFNLNMHYWEQHINEMPAERSAFGCTIIRRAKDDKRMLVISGGHGGGVTDFSYWTFMDTNKYSWNILVSDSAAVSYAHILQLSSREFYLFESQSGPDAGYTNYWYYWQDNSIEGNENVIQKYQKNRQSPRQFFAVASIPRSSLILGNCVKPSP